MIRVIANDGSVFEGRDEVEVVRQMRAFQWEAPEKKGDYMEEVARRVNQMTGFGIRNDPHGFVSDLETLGMLRVDRRE